MANADGYADIDDYLSEFRDLLEPQLPEELPGSRSIQKLHTEYVGRQDKRSVLIFIKTGPNTVLSVRYRMPVMPKAAPLFRLPEGLVPHESPIFAMVSPAEVAPRAAAADMVLWDTEQTRLRNIVDDPASEERLRRTARNVLLYWRLLRGKLQDVYAELGIRPQDTGTNARSSTRSNSGSEPRLPTPRPNSDPARRRTSSARRRTSSARRRTSSARRRTSSAPRSIRRTSSNRSRRMSSASSRRSNSDPRRRRRTTG
jgi:hypothetical protein